MSENNVVSGEFRKGFRQKAKATKGEVDKENRALSVELAAELLTIKQQLGMTMQRVQRMSMELGSLANILRNKASDEAAAMGDRVMIDYYGRLVNEDGSIGNTFEGGFSLGDVYELGSKSLVEGFEAQLVGHKEGALIEVNVTFPDNYPSALKNRKAQFKVKMIGVWKSKDPANTIETEFQAIRNAEEATAKALEAAKAPEETPAS